MEKPKDRRSERNEKQSSEEKAKSLVWDCGSTLYDSFELNSFNRQLDSAISSRTMSMPHLTDQRRRDPPSPSKKQLSKLSRSLRKLLRSVFGSKRSSTSSEGYNHFRRKSGALSAIPEVTEVDYASISPEISSLVRKTASERFMASSVTGASCA
ncbi:hypothetical protein Nepgr_024503 [Nepenthes gracilis]|uniref:Uncharacterized protein n=1 Tax=Nepenthes gracilis TaxID=150966 RepID=A0AAD3T4C4_NEPGR|nr:hypothetical protein Nepgr_024503 [Nepenthes gracilis]